MCCYHNNKFCCLSDINLSPGIKFRRAIVHSQENSGHGINMVRRQGWNRDMAVQPLPTNKVYICCYRNHHNNAEHKKEVAIINKSIHDKCYATSGEVSCPGRQPGPTAILSKNNVMCPKQTFLHWS